jgi:hypothetical protein
MPTSNELGALPKNMISLQHSSTRIYQLEDDINYKVWNESKINLKFLAKLLDGSYNNNK